MHKQWKIFHYLEVTGNNKSWNYVTVSMVHYVFMFMSNKHIIFLIVAMMHTPEALNGYNWKHETFVLKHSY